MPDLSFQIEDIKPVPHAAVPMLAMTLRIGCTPPNIPIHSIMLRCQVRIEPTRRRYTTIEQERLTDLFGEAHRWSQTLHAMLWTRVDVNVGPFTGETRFDLIVPCTFDFNVAATKYFEGLGKDGDIPLCLLFSGTIFHGVSPTASGSTSRGAPAGAPPGAGLRIAQVPWEKEARFRLPVRTWRNMMREHYANNTWLCLRKDAFDRLRQYKRVQGLPTWEQAIEHLLEEKRQPV